MITGSLCVCGNLVQAYGYRKAYGAYVEFYKCKCGDEWEVDFRETMKIDSRNLKNIPLREAKRADVTELLYALKMFTENSSVQVNYPDYCEYAEALIAKHGGGA